MGEAVARIAFQVQVAAAFDFLDWSGDDWPQPVRVLGLSGWDWEDLDGLSALESC